MADFNYIQIPNNDVRSKTWYVVKDVLTSFVYFSTAKCINIVKYSNLYRVCVCVCEWV